MSLPWQTSGRTRLFFSGVPAALNYGWETGVLASADPIAWQDNARRWRQSEVKVCRVADIVESKDTNWQRRREMIPGPVCNSYIIPTGGKKK